MIAISPIRALAGPSDIAEVSTTDGTIALLNLEAQIERRQSAATLCHSQVENQVTLVELIALRGLILGRVADYERAVQMRSSWRVTLPPVERPSWRERGRGPTFIVLRMPWTTLKLRCGFHWMPRPQVPSAPRSSKRSDVMMRPLRFVKKLQTVGRTLRLLELWPGSGRSAAMPKQHNACTATAGAATAVSHRSRWRFSIFRSA